MYRAWSHNFDFLRLGCDPQNPNVLAKFLLKTDELKLYFYIVSVPYPQRWASPIIDRQPTGAFLKHEIDTTLCCVDLEKAFKLCGGFYPSKSPV